MRTKLSPFVYKVKGDKNFLFFDSLKGQIYSISPVGNPFELEAGLIENELVIETEGVIPFKFQPDIAFYKSNLVLRELQLRISEKCFFDCADCGEAGKCKRGTGTINKEWVELIAKQLKNIQLETISIVGGNPLLMLDVVEYVKTKIIALNYRIMFPSSKIDELEKEKEALDKMEITIVDSICDIGKISEENMTVNVMEFFYNQEFNSCWGNKLAIDIGGDIKPCLWSERVLGNVDDTTISSLILAHKLDDYWELTKDKIDICKGCEFRFSCSDCRVIAEKASGTLFGKTSFCSYLPGAGEWRSEQENV